MSRNPLFARLHGGIFYFDKVIFSSAASLIICGTCSAASTILHYSLNDTDAAGLPNIPSVGGSAGTAQGTFSGILSSDVPTTGVPAGAGNRSIVGAGSDASDGINSPTTQELSNTLVTTNGGFTMESWFLWNGGGNVNSIIDYAGTEKFRMNSTGTLDFNFDSGLGAQIIATIEPGTWHYVAAVFEWDGGPVSATGGIGGTLTYFLDSITPLGSVAAIKDDFGDSLNRPIGVGRHPIGFGGDNFDGLIYEPRVSLGALSPGELLFTPIPEPSTPLFGILSSALFLARRKRF